MNIVEIPLAKIDLQDEAFRISEELDPQAMRASLLEVGQLSPVVVIPKGDAYQILCGFRRARALQGLGQTNVLARVFGEGIQDSRSAFLLALWDNLAHRVLEPLEKARVLFTLTDTCGLDRRSAVEVYMPLLGLKPHQNVLDAYLSLHTLNPCLRQMLNEGKITITSAERLAGQSQDAQDSLAALLLKIRLSASLQREVLGLIEELSAIMGSSCRELLCRPGIEAIMADPLLSPYQKGERIREILYRWRNPRLSGATDRFLTGKMALNLPGAIRLTPDPFFETPSLRVEFDVSSAQRFRELAAAIQEAAQSPALEGLFKLD